MTGIFKYEANTQKQTIFRQSLFGNYYSTLNYSDPGHYRDRGNTKTRPVFLQKIDLLEKLQR